MKSVKGTVWLVKSTNGQILGPYAESQIADLLRDRIVVPLDEVSKPCDRWTYLRDTPQFAKAVEELRQRMLKGSSDDTATQGDNTSGKTMSISESMTDELTQDITKTDSKIIQDVLFQAVEDDIRSRTRSSASIYTHEGDAFIKNQADRSSRIIWAITATVIFITIGTVVFHHYIARPIEQKAQVELGIESGIEALESADYKLALSEFKKVYDINPNVDKIYLYLAILHIQLENRTFEGRNLLEKIINNPTADQKRVYVGIALSYLKEKNIELAEMNLKKALEIEPLYGPALVNMSIMAMYRQDWTKAIAQLQPYVKENPKESVVILLLSHAFIENYKSTKNPNFLDEAYRLLTENKDRMSTYKQEALTNLIYIVSLLKRNQDSYDLINEALDMDYQETNDHRQNLFIDYGLVSWTSLVNWCLESTHDLEPNARVIAYEALCLNLSGQAVDANRKIDDAMAQSPKDAAVLSVYAHILMNAQAHEKASIAIEKALQQDEDQKLEEPIRAKARYCEITNDIECQEKNWTKLHSLNPNSLAALAGLANVSLNKNKLKAAKSYLEKGMKLSVDYKPFYSVNKTISRIEDAAQARGL